MATAKPDFEKSLTSLEKIVDELENGECTLDEAIKLFEQGMTDIKACRKALDMAEKKIISLTEVEKLEEQ